jgi:hypothetical protein
LKKAFCLKFSLQIEREEGRDVEIWPDPFKKIRHKQCCPGDFFFQPGIRV